MGQPASAGSSGSAGERRCPECGTPVSIAASRSPWWTRRVPAIVTMLLLCTVVALSVLRLERLRGAALDPVASMTLIQPPLDGATLQQFTDSGEAPAGFVARLLETAPIGGVEPPWPFTLYVRFDGRSADRIETTRIGRPFRWLVMRRLEPFEDIVEGVAVTRRDLFTSWLRDYGWRRDGSVGGWLRRGPDDGGRDYLYASIRIEAVAITLMLLALAAIIAGRGGGRRLRRRITVVVLIALALAAWSVLDVERTRTVEPRRQMMFRFSDAPKPANPTVLTTADLRELREQRGGGAEAAAAIAAVTPIVDDRLLSIGYFQPRRWDAKGWRCGWPLHVVSFAAITRSVQRPPRATRLGLRDERLVIIAGNDQPTAELKELRLHLTGILMLLLGLPLAWWLTRWVGVTAATRRARRRPHGGKCLACGYRLGPVKEVAAAGAAEGDARGAS